MPWRGAQAGQRVDAERDDPGERAAEFSDADGALIGEIELRSESFFSGWIDARLDAAFSVTIRDREDRSHVEFVARPDLDGTVPFPARGFFCVFDPKLVAGDEVSLAVGGRPVTSFRYAEPAALSDGDLGHAVVQLDEPQDGLARRHLHFAGWVRTGRVTGNIRFAVNGRTQEASFHARWDAILRLATSRVVGFAFDHERTGAVQDLVLTCDVNGREIYRKRLEARPVAPGRVGRPLILFMHIPKTAGTSLANAFRKQPDLESYWLYPSSRTSVLDQLSALGGSVDGFDLIGGHFAYGLHRHIGRDCQYITFLREPRDLLLSFFNYTKHVVREPAWADLTFAQAVAGRVDPHLDNPLTRYLSGAPPDQPVGKELFAQAKENMARHFTFVGVVERMNRSIGRLSDAFGLELDVRYDNRTPAADRRASDDTELDALLRPFIAFDEEIYRAARDELG